MLTTNIEQYEQKLKSDIFPNLNFGVIKMNMFSNRRTKGHTQFCSPTQAQTAPWETLDGIEQSAKDREKHIAKECQRKQNKSDKKKEGKKRKQKTTTFETRPDKDATGIGVVWEQEILLLCESCFFFSLLFERPMLLLAFGWWSMANISRESSHLSINDSTQIFALTRHIVCVWLCVYADSVHRESLPFLCRSVKSRPKSEFYNKIVTAEIKI